MPQECTVKISAPFAQRVRNAMRDRHAAYPSEASLSYTETVHKRVWLFIHRSMR